MIVEWGVEGRENIVDATACSYATNTLNTQKIIEPPRLERAKT
jgi:hypothetical protein